jgi:hypothetical protein
LSAAAIREHLLGLVPGSKVYKSFQAAIADVTRKLEKQHYDTHAKLKKARHGNRRKGP